MKTPNRKWFDLLRTSKKKCVIRRLLLESLEERRVMAVVDWSGDIPDGTVWRAGDVQRFTGSVRVPVGATVTAEPGAIVKFGHFSFSLTVSGTLNAIGTSASPIVFTEIRDDSGGDTNGDGSASAPGRGNWTQILIGSGGTANLEHSQIRYGGFNSPGQLTVNGGSLALRNSTISDSVSDGVRIQNADPVLANNRYERNVDAAVSMDLGSNPAISGVTMVNNGLNGLQVDGGNITKDGFWNDADIAYVLNGTITVAANTKLTLGAGQVIKFGHFSFSLFVNGTLDAQSPNAAPIVFTELRDDVGGDTNNDGTNTTPNNGNWTRIELAGPANVLRNVEVRHGGFNSSASLLVKGGTLNYTEGKIQKSASAGLRIENSSPTISNVQFLSNTVAAVRMDLASNPVISGNNGPVVATGNGINGLLVDGGTISSNAFWDDQNIVYVTSDTITVGANTKLTVGAGQVIKFGHFSFSLFVNGTLDAQSPNTAPIVFTELRDDAGGDTNNDGTNTTPNNGNWARIELAGPANVLRNVEVRHGGFNSSASLLVKGGALNYTEGKIQKSSSAGLRIENSNPTISNVQFLSNTVAAVRMDLASNPVISGNNGPVVATGSGVNGLLLDGGTISANAFWDDPEIVYVTNDTITVAANAKLTVGAGQVIKFGHLSYSLIVNGTLDGHGTAVAPIVFTEFRDDTGGDTNGDGTASAPGRGNWAQILVGSGGTANLEHSQIRYGGFSSPGQLAVNGGSLALRNSTISDSVSDGVRIQNTDPVLTNNRYERNVDAAVSMDLGSNPAISGVTMVNNGLNGLQVDGGNITKDGFWNDADIAYVLNGTITVAANTKLTVGTGQVIKFGHFSFSLFVNGTLDGQSPNAAPIVFTELRDDVGGDTNNDGTNSAPNNGNWARIELAGPANVLRNVEVRHGGFNSSASLLVKGGTLNYTEGKIQKSASVGLRIENSNPTISNVQFLSNTVAAATMDLVSNPVISGNNGPIVTSGNGINGLLLDGGTISANAFWDDQDIVYVTNGTITVAANSRLTVGAGQVIKFAHFTYNLIVHGTLQGRGTAASQIVFTELRDDTGGDTNNNANASAPGRGNWGRIELNGANNVMEQVHIRHGGFGSVAQLSVLRGGLSFVGGAVAESSAAGMRLIGNGVTINGVQIRNNSGAAISLDLDSNPVFSGLVLSNNGINGARLDAGFIYCNAKWDDATIPYVLSGDVTVPPGSSLEIGPGQVVKASSGHEIVVNGKLIARGTVAEPVIFTSLRDDTAFGDTNNNGPSTAGNGDWTGLRLTSVSNNNELAFTEVRFAGDNGVGAVVVDTGKLTVSNSTIRNSSSRGITARNSATLQMSNDLIYANTDTAIQVESGATANIFNVTVDGNRRGVTAADASVTLTNSLVTNHSRSGIFVSGTGVVTASFNDVFNPAASAGNYEGLQDQTGRNSNLSANPLYVDAAARNYELGSGSPAIDSATSTGAPATDLRSRPRADDTSVANSGTGSVAFVDRGALERQAGAGGESEAGITAVNVGEGRGPSIYDLVANSRSAWINTFNLLDVNSDGFTSAIDVLLIVNDINSVGSRLLPATRPSGQSFIDVNGDSFVSAIDALFIINELNIGLSPEVITFVEQGAFAREASRTLSLGGSGVRHVRLEVKSVFNTSAVDSKVPDRLLLYLVNPLNRGETFVDNGRAGTPFFSWDGTTAEYPAGTVRFDGRFIDIDLTALGGTKQGSLIAQLLNSDSDTDGRAFVRVISNQLDPAGTLPPQLILPSAVVAPSGSLNTSALVDTSQLTPIIDNVRYNSETGRFAANLRVRNDGPSIGRQVAVAFAGLSGGVALANPSGTLVDSTEYLSLRDAIGAGGLANGATSQTILVEINNANRTRFPLVPRFLAGGQNQPPVLAAIPTLNATPGSRLEHNLIASDPDGDAIQFSLLASGALPDTVLKADGTLVISPTREQVGTFNFTVQASDGSSTVTRQVTVNVARDSLTTTRVSGTVRATDQSPLAGVRVEIGAVQGLTQNDGSFLLDLGSGTVVTDTLKVRGELFSGAVVYPFIAEKLPLVLEHDVIQGVNNVISRPIFLLALNVAGGTAINPTQTTNVVQEFAPGLSAKLVVAAGSLMNQQGTPFNGVLSITQVPANLTPAALPENLVPSTVVTIQPGEMVFATPAPLTIPNTDGWAAGTLMDLWSINPVTGQFDIVGTGRVSPNGASVETISGGIRNSSWHFVTTQPAKPVPPQKDPANIYEGCEECAALAKVNSEVELHSGAVIEMHSTVPYQSQGMQRSITLTYDSLRADPRPIVHVSFDDVDPSIYSVPSALRLIAKLAVHRGNLNQELPGYTGTLPGLSGGEHFWSLPPGRGSVTAGLQVDLRGQPSGRYEYDMTSGVLGFAGSRGYIGSSTTQHGNFLLVNSIDSPFGAGWGLAELQEIVENPDGSVLIIRGDGGELLFDAPASPGAAYESPPGDFSTLVKRPDGTFRRTMKDQSSHRFNSQNRIAETRDRNGNTMRFEYDVDGMINKIVDPVGLATNFTRTGKRITSIIDPAGRATQLAYDTAGNLSRVTDPDGTQRSFGYDSNHHLTSEVDKRGFREESVYDFAGRLASSKRKDGSIVSVRPLQVQGLFPPNTTIDPFAAPQTVRSSAANAGFADGRGNVIATTLDGAGQVASQVDTIGTLPGVRRNNENLVTSERDSRGHATGYSYDSSGNLLRTVDEVSAAGLLAMYTFEGDARDVTGSGRDGTVSGASIDAGYEGNGFRFDGINDFIDIPVNINASLHPRLTMGAWVKVDNATPIRQVLSQTDGCFDRSFGIDSRGGDSGWSAFSGTGEVLGAQPVVVGQWTFIAAVYDQNASLVTFYVDDKKLTEAGTLTDGFSTVRIGSSPIFGEFLAGTVDNVFFFADALTETQINSIRTGGAGAVLNAVLGGRSHEYEANFSQKTKQVDELGRQTLYSINSINGNTESMTRVVGTPGGGDDLLTSMTYDAQGLIASMTDPNGHVTQYERDPQGRPTKITRAAGTPAAEVERFEYDAAGNATAMVDANGNRTAFEYDSQGRVTRITEQDPDGAGPLAAPVSNMAYDTAGNLTKLTDGLGRQTQFTFDALDRLTERTDPDGKIERMRYDADGNLVSMTDKLGRETRYRYDARGRVIEKVDPLSGAWQWRYDLDGNMIAETDANGHTTNYTYDARGRLTRSVDALGGITTYRYDLADQLIAVTDANGHTTQYQYDDLGRRVSQRDPLGGEQKFQYDANGNLASVSDELNRTTRYAYDTRDRLNSITNPLNASKTFQYDAVGNLTRTTDELNRPTQFVYDGLNRWTSRTDPLGGTVSITYDAEDNIVRASDELNRVTQFVYDNLDRATSTTDPLGHVWTTNYDAVGNVLRSADPLGHGVDFVYDKLDRVTQQTDARGGITNFSYDAVGNILRLTDPVKNTTRYQYDALNRATSETDALGKSRLYTYDPVGNLITATDRNGRVRQFAYDALDRRTKERWIDSGNNALRTIDYAFDAASQLTSASDVDSAYSYTHDLDGRVTTVSNSGSPGVPAVVFTYAYDALDNLLTRGDTINGLSRGTNSYTYDVLNRMTRVTQSGTGVVDKRVDMAYDAASQMTGVTRFADLTGTQLVAASAHTYDAAGRLTALTHAKGTATLAQYSWIFDDANRITRMTSNDGTSNFTYDDTNQLTAADHSFQTDEVYSYDLNGNRTNAGYKTGANNHLTSDGTFNYTYDAEGNRASRTNIATGAITEYGWDYRNRLTRLATKSAGGSVTSEVRYTYDIYDRRIAKSVDSDGAGPTSPVVERFIYDGSHIAFSLDNAGIETHRYLHGPALDQILADESANDFVLWTLTDNLGSVRDLVDSIGVVRNHISYSSFGQLISETNPIVDFLFAFAGREFDRETQLFYNRARYYDSQTGHFVSEDPIGFDAGDANLYRYVENNPVSATDPTGLDMWIEAGNSGELPLHRSINIGDPNGVYDSYSLNLMPKLSFKFARGVIFPEYDRGHKAGSGNILSGYYRKLSANEDQQARELLEKLVQLSMQEYESSEGINYFPGIFTCRDFAFQTFDALSHLGVPATPQRPFGVNISLKDVGVVGATGVLVVFGSTGAAVVGSVMLVGGFGMTIIDYVSSSKSSDVAPNRDFLPTGLHKQ